MDRLIDRITNNESESSLAHACRRTRFDVFHRLLATVPRPCRILDVGGTQAYWDRMGFSDPTVEIVLVNLEATPVTRPAFEAVVGDARALDDVPDGAFDVVFSNSVIEHLGDLRSQRAMAAEVRRVGRRYWVQTPNRHFPLEAHALLPFIQYLPARMRGAIVARHRPGWYRGCPPDLALAEALAVRLLTSHEMRQLFPGATLWQERILGLTKSLIVHAGFDRPGPARSG